MTTIQILNRSNPSVIINASLAKSFFSKLAGLMFQKYLPDQSGLLLADSSESKINTSIHMLFMNFDICVVWINQGLQVVDVKYAKKWALAYFPKKAAQYTLELNTSHMQDFSVGDQLDFSNEK